jgi:hypothetical protein
MIRSLEAAYGVIFERETKAVVPSQVKELATTVRCTRSERIVRFSAVDEVRLVQYDSC